MHCYIVKRSQAFDNEYLKKNYHWQNVSVLFLKHLMADGQEGSSSSDVYTAKEDDLSHSLFSESPGNGSSVRGGGLVVSENPQHIC